MLNQTSKCTRLGSYSTKTCGGHRASAFTLIELLVVISIISILISILLPALAGAKKSAMATQCSSKFHQLGIGVMMYLNDYNDTYMHYLKNDGPTKPIKQWYVGSVLGRYLLSNGNNQSMTTSSKTNASDRKVYDCPVNPPYSNGIDFTFNRDMEWKRATDISSNKVLFAENRDTLGLGTNPGWKISFNSTWGFKDLGYWHNQPKDPLQYSTSNYTTTFPSGSANVLHIDGHSSRIKAPELKVLAKR